MKIIITFIDVSKSFSLYENQIPYISAERQKKILRFKFDKDKIISLFTELLIKKSINQEFGVSYNDITFSYNEYGKPYLKDKDNYYFSVSHSKNCIVFISDCNPIGIDIEKITTKNPLVARRFFTINENILIDNSNNPNIAFFDIWTKKESYIKMIGLGLSKPLTSFDVTSTDLQYLFKTKHIDDYSLTVCSSNPSDIHLEEVDYHSLLR